MTRFSVLWHELEGAGFWCLNAETLDEVYPYLEDGSIRFAIREKIEPNMEVKFAKMALDLFSLHNCLTLVMNKKLLCISPLEVQIAFKMYLNSEKDIEDARFLWLLFKEYLDNERLKYFANQLKVKGEVFDHVTTISS